MRVEYLNRCSIPSGLASGMVGVNESKADTVTFTGGVAADPAAAASVLVYTAIF